MQYFVSVRWYLDLGRAFITHKLLALNLANDRSLELDSQDYLNVSVTDAPFLRCFGFYFQQ